MANFLWTWILLLIPYTGLPSIAAASRPATDGEADGGPKSGATEEPSELNYNGLQQHTVKLKKLVEAYTNQVRGKLQDAAATVIGTKEEYELYIKALRNGQKLQDQALQAYRSATVAEQEGIISQVRSDSLQQEKPAEKPEEIQDPQVLPLKKK
eukprot:TRINITY_DN20538_c0_g1_i1.p1 TRINITY_DN20538_c0_g1~~TRINITY_DN20538_c0_g1_i1.p1  ORF type:complete len:154 (-),score=38.27 TRINITY_DN20538_c0_g1_i1:156-617(-)